MTIHDAHIKLLLALQSIYENREAANIADWIFESVTGKKKIDRIINKHSSLDVAHELKLDDCLSQLLQHKPVQYVINEAWFAGMKLYVDEAVLIPRPETEELVEWIVADERSRNYEIPSETKEGEQNSKIKIQNFESCILDVGTGSGCIPIALKKKLPKANITAVDVSEEALLVAKKNADAYDLDIGFIQLDFLDKEQWKTLGKYDVIVSNPPYIKKSEEGTMNRNVIEHEPHLALFVPDEDALIFFKALAEFAQMHLNTNGKMYVEINEALGRQVIKFLEGSKLQDVVLKKDLQEKDRMIKASLY